VSAERLLAERVARESYGRLVAQLAARTRDVAAAEDALGDAFAAALRAWQTTGPPDNPEAWLFAAAKRKLIDSVRRAQTASDNAREVERIAEEIETEMQEAPLPDRRLGLMFACAHPAIEPAARTALMLQTVLGLSGERIAAAYLVEPSAMSQRLVRAKRKIKDAGIPFHVPDTDEWPERLACVLDAVYAAYAEGWIDAQGLDAARRALAEEAIWLCRVLVGQMPDEPEALGLLALVLHLHARRNARRDVDAQGRYVPLSEQDCRLWDETMIEEAEQTLLKAAKAGRPGRYQLEAAIQSAHAARRNGATDWPAIISLYDALCSLTDSAVARLNRTAVLAHAGKMDRALMELQTLEGDLAHYQPYWALKAHVFGKLGRKEEARAAYAEAIAREADPAVIGFLEKKAQELGA
jgi:RNA polymerase sigma-70 factor (ECF subfamily)